VITSQPAGQTNIIGSSPITLSIEVTGSSPSYQWYSNGQAVVGATFPTNNVSTAQTNSGAGYFVIVSNALGAVGYATTIAEIEAQAARLSFAPTAIVHCTGSAGTQAGLVAGAAVAMPNTAIVGIDIDAEPARVRADVVTFAKEASDLLDIPFDETKVEVVAGHAGPAYGVPHEATIEAIRLAGRLEALALDPVYSGKGLAGLIALIRQRRWRRDEDVIFLHTGGAPALFAYQSALGI